MKEFRIKAARVRRFFKRAKDIAKNQSHRDKKYVEGYLDGIIDLTGLLSDPKELNDYASDDAHTYLTTGRWPKKHE